MIKINLVPVDELENRYWYVPDLVGLVLIGLLSYFSVDFYFKSIQLQVDDSTEKTASLEASTAQLAPDLKRFESLDKDVKTLDEKLNALKRITTSKIDKFIPVIVLEHFQNLKPSGVWYTELTIGTPKPDVFSLKGQAFDNILTAELMSSIRATSLQEMDPTDLRTQVYFENLVLGEASIGTKGSFDELKIYPIFEMSGQYKERIVPKNQLPSIDDKKITEEDSKLGKVALENDKK